MDGKWQRQQEATYRSRAGRWRTGNVTLESKILSSTALTDRVADGKEGTASKGQEIWKTQNRRLYSITRRDFVTNKYVDKLITRGVDISVVTKPAGNDITCLVLLQIIATREERAAPALSADFLSQAIRSHGHVPPDLLATFLEQSLRFLASHCDHGRKGPISDREAHRLAD